MLSGYLHCVLTRVPSLSLSSLSVSLTSLPFSLAVHPLAVAQIQYCPVEKQRRNLSLPLSTGSLVLFITSPSPLSHSLSLSQGFYWKAKVLQDMGQVDDSLQVFLHCLALDEDFTLAKREVENVRDGGRVVVLLLK